MSHQYGVEQVSFEKVGNNWISKGKVRIEHSKEEGGNQQKYGKQKEHDMLGKTVTKYVWREQKFPSGKQWEIRLKQIGSKSGSP